MKAKDTFDKIFATISKISQFIAACFLLIMICTVTIQVFGRIFKFSLPWTEEVGTYSLIWMTYIASVAVTVRGEHLTVDLFLNRYTPAMKRVVRVLIDLMIVIFCGMLMIFGFQLCQNKIILNGRTPALQISRLWIYLSVPIAMTFNSLFVLYDLVIAVADLCSRGKLTKIEEERKAAEEALHAEEIAREEAEIKAAMLGTDEETNNTEEKEEK